MGKVKKSRFAAEEDDEPLNTELEAEEDADDASDSDDPKEYEVLEILEHRRREGNAKKRDYLIRWTEPYDDPKHDSWEPEENLFCEALIATYWEKRKDLKAQKGTHSNGASSEKRLKKKKKQSKDSAKSPDRAPSESDGEKVESYKKVKDLGSRPHPEKAKRDSQFKKLKEAVREKKMKKVYTKSLEGERSDEAESVKFREKKMKKVHKTSLERERSEEAESVRLRTSPRRLNTTTETATEDSPVEAPVPKSNGLDAEKPVGKVKKNGMGKKGPVNIIASTPRKRARLLELVSSEDEDSSHAISNTAIACDDDVSVPPDDKPSQKDVNRDLFGSSLSSLSPSPPVPCTRSSRSSSRKNSRDSSLPNSRKSSPNSGALISNGQKRKNSALDVSEKSPKKSGGPLSWTEGDYVHLIINGEPFRYNVNTDTDDDADRWLREIVLLGIPEPSATDHTKEEGAKIKKKKKRVSTTAVDEVLPKNLSNAVDDKSQGESVDEVAAVVTCAERKTGGGEELVQPDVCVVEPALQENVDIVEAALEEPLALEREKTPDQNAGSQENMSADVISTGLNTDDKMTADKEPLCDPFPTADNPYQTVAILPDTYSLLASTPLVELIVESIKCAEDHVNKVFGFCVQFKGFPGMVFLPEETMRDYFLENLLDFYEALLTPPSA